MDIAAALSAIGQGIGLLKELNQVDQQIDQAGQKLRIAELSTALATAQITLSEAYQELADRDNTISELKRAFEIRAETIELEGFSYEQAEGRPVGLPYCPRCQAIDGRMMRLVKDHGRGISGCYCPECNRKFLATRYLYRGERV